MGTVDKKGEALPWGKTHRLASHRDSMKRIANVSSIVKRHLLQVLMFHDCVTAQVFSKNERRDTGQSERRFKCQACGKWLGKAF